MSLAEQLAWQRAENDRKAAEKAGAGKPAHDPNADLKKMTLAEQLAWQRAENDRKAAEKAGAKPSEPEKPAHDPNADLKKMTLA
jgi:hypothetical protein